MAACNGLDHCVVVFVYRQSRTSICVSRLDFDVYQLRNCMFEIWDGDLFLYSVDTRYEADEQAEAGFTVVEYRGVE
jgi:hypothetical protein